MKKIILVGTKQKVQDAIHKFPVILEEAEVFAPPQETSGLKNVKGGAESKNSVISLETIGRDDFNRLVIADSSSFEDSKRTLMAGGASKKKIYSLKEYIFDLLVRGKILPRRAWIDVCTRCQLNCATCYMRRNEDKVTTGLDYCRYENFKKFIDDTPEIKQIEISNNGEPFLNPELPDILRYASEHHIGISVSNGTNFNTVSEETLELLVKTGVLHISVSLDGASQETYAAYRRNGNFDKVIENIKKINFWKKRYHSNLPRMTWKFILMNHNKGDAARAKQMAEELGMEIFFDLTWDPGFRASEKEAESLREITGLNFLDRATYKKTTKKSYNSWKCKQLFFSPAINWDGTLMGCCDNWHCDFGVNVFELGLENALSSETYVEAKRMLLGDKYFIAPMNPCLKCHYYEDMKDDDCYLSRNEMMSQMVKELGIESLVN